MKKMRQGSAVSYLQNKSHFRIIPVGEDREEVKRYLRHHWGSHMIVTQGHVHDASALPGYVALLGEDIVGLITYNIEEDNCEIVSLNSSIQGVGVGTALLKPVEMHAGDQNCSRLWLITTNDNQPALGFYQKRGFTIVTIHHDAIKESRKIKPEIPLLGVDGIPIRDEIELALDLPYPANRSIR